jgi:hypothetical protein
VTDASLPCLRRRLGALGPCGVAGSWQVCDGFGVERGGRRGSGPGWWWRCVEAAASRPKEGRCFMGWSRCLLGLGGSLVSPVRRGCRLGRPVSEEAVLTFRPGRRPWMLVRRSWSTSSFPCAAWAAGGWVVWRCGSSSSGGMSGRRSRKMVLVVCRAWWCSWMSGRQPRGLSVLSASHLVSCGRRGCLDAGRRRHVPLLFWRVGFFIFVGASRVFSSHSTHGIFSPALVGGHLVLVGWCCSGCVGFALLYRF